MPDRQRPSRSRASATQLAIIEAEERGATTPRDLLILQERRPQQRRHRNGAHGRARARPHRTPVADSRHSPVAADTRCRKFGPKPRTRSAQAAQGFKIAQERLPARVSIASTQAALIARLNVEADASVRAALCEAVARLPYKTRRRRRTRRADHRRARRSHGIHDHGRSSGRARRASKRSFACTRSRDRPAAAAIAAAQVVRAPGRTRGRTGTAARRAESAASRSKD